MVWSSLVSLLHVFGLALAVGGATVKLVLLLKCSFESAFVQTYVTVSKIVTRQIIVGMVLLTLSGIAWLVLGYPFTSRLVLKLALVAAIWVLGPILDNIVEPRFRALAPRSGEAPSPAFVSATKRFVTLELLATSLFYIVIAIWLLR